MQSMDKILSVVYGVYYLCVNLNMRQSEGALVVESEARAMVFIYDRVARSLGVPLSAGIRRSLITLTGLSTTHGFFTPRRGRDGIGVYPPSYKTAACHLRCNIQGNFSDTCILRDTQWF